MTARCHFCGAPAAEGESPRSALCEAHQAIHQHVVSIRSGLNLRKPDGSFAAVCKCGWSHSGDSPTRREEAIERHWQSVVEETAK